MFETSQAKKRDALYKKKSLDTWQIDRGFVLVERNLEQKWKKWLNLFSGGFIVLDGQGHVAGCNVFKFCHCLRQTIWNVAVREHVDFGKER